MEHGTFWIINIVLLIDVLALSSTITPIPTTTESTSTSVAPSTSAIQTTSSPSSTTTVLSLSNQKAAGDERYVGVGVGVGVGGFFLLLSAILVIAFFCCRKCKKEKENEDLDSPMQPFVEKEMILEMPARERREVGVRDLIALLRERRKNKHLYQEEFKSLPPSCRPRIKSCSEAAAHPSKNRYTDILPYNVDRVKLLSGHDDYINASFVDGFEKENEFIATQGPLKDTCDNFWTLVWEQKSEKIIMVTNTDEDGMPKCASYFPCKENEGIAAKVMTFKNISVSLMKEERFEDYVVREFNIQKGNEKRPVEQFHFTNWPDKGVPETCTSLLKFQKACLGSGRAHDNPVVIHCSAGVGRTGTLLATNLLLREAEKTDSVDVPTCVDRMRRRRMAMVQTISQYIFTYHTVVEALALGDVCMKPDEFMQKYLELDKPVRDGKSYLEIQFELLEASKPHFGQHSFTNGMSHRDHNRFSKILPIDDFMPSFSTTSDEYINAVHVSGFRGFTDIIVTQSPMPGDFETFWKLVKEHKCWVVVMLNDLLENEPKYWPSDGIAESHGQMAVMNAGEISSDDIVASDFRVSNLSHKAEDIDHASESKEDKNGAMNEAYDISSDGIDDIVKNQISKDPENLHVRHFRLSGWDEKHYPKDKISSLLSLTAEVRRCLKRVPDGTLLVHCLNGADKSGLFCALLNVMWKMEKTGVVDVHNAVKMVQKRRTQFVNTPEQLKYLYDIVHHYLSSIKPAG